MALLTVIEEEHRGEELASLSNLGIKAKKFEVLHQL